MVCGHLNSHAFSKYTKLLMFGFSKHHPFLIHPISVLLRLHNLILHKSIWLRVTGEGILPKTPVWSILIFLFDLSLKCCIQLSISILFVFKLHCRCPLMDYIIFQYCFAWKFNFLLFNLSIKMILLPRRSA